MRKIILIFLIFFLTMLALAGCRGSASPQEEAVDISEIEARDVGEEVVTDGIKWKVTEVENLGSQLLAPDNLYALEAEEGKFINITFTVSNNSDEEKQIFDLRVIDDKGRTFTICVEAYSVLSPGGADACTLARVLPNTERTFNTTFDVETDSEKLVLEVTDLDLPPEQKEYIDLGI